MMTPGATHDTKRVGFLELFFDLVFVFAITQLAKALHLDHGAAGWGRSAILMWLVWWAWSQYTWAANAIDLDSRSTRLWVLVATGTMLVAAAALPSAFGDGGAWFAVPYVAVRLIGLGLYWTGLGGDREHQEALRSYLPVQLLSPLLVLAGGLADGDVRTALWLAAIVVDVVSVLAAGRGEFRVDPGHFAERHGLIVIIALGESVIVLGATAASVGLDRPVVVLLALAYAAVAGLWWCYFDWVHAAAEVRLAGEDDHRRRGHLARDLFTLGHLPIVAGTVVFAVAVDEAMSAPTDPLDGFAATALAVGPCLFLAGFVAGNLRATGQLLVSRVIGIVAIVLAVAAAGTRADAAVSVGLVALAIAAVALLERGRHRPAG